MTGFSIADVRAGARAAHDRIRDLVIETPLRHSPYLSRLTGAEVCCKLENVQVSGSFKARGAANKLSLLSPADRQRGVVTASSGNHGAAVAAMLSRLGGRGIVFVPETTPAVKIEAIAVAGCEVRRHGEDSGYCETLARDHAAAKGMSYVSPYNDADIIAGQGTIGVEIASQMKAPDIVSVSVGGGGLISGIAAVLKGENPKLTVIGASAENDHAMLLSARAGRAVPHGGAAPTLSDGTAGSVEEGSITIPLCAELVDEWPTASEAEIAGAMRDFLAREAMVIEGAAGVAVAGLLALARKAPDRVRGKRAVVVICGGRVDAAKLVKIIAP